MGFQGLIGYGGGATGLNVASAGGGGLTASGGNATSTPGDGNKYHYFLEPGNLVV